MLWAWAPNPRRPAPVEQGGAAATTASAPPDATTAIGAYLRSRRARLNPEDCGLVSFGRRRVPGLRRAELAELAGVSIDYYRRLEQGRAARPSDAVLDAIARALRLDVAEHAHLYALCRPAVGAMTSRAPVRRPQRVRPELHRLLAAMHDVPALVFGHRLDVLAHNALAAALITDFSGPRPEQRNLARHVFLDPSARGLYADWETVAREVLGVLRACAGRHPADPGLAALVGELSVRSDAFRRLWDIHDVRAKTHGVKHLRHPVAGALTRAYETFRLHDDPDQVLVTYYPADPSGPDGEALRQLASWAADPRPAGTRVRLDGR